MVPVGPTGTKAFLANKKIKAGILLPALGPELLLPALGPGASPRRRRRSCCRAPSRSCWPPLLLPRSGPILPWPPRHQEPPSSRPCSGAACPSPPERPPPRKATHGPCPRGAPPPNGGGRRGAEEGERARTATGPDVDHQKGGSPLAAPAAMDAACAERLRLQIRRGPPLLRPRWPAGVLLRVSQGSSAPLPACCSA